MKRNSTLSYWAGRSMEEGHSKWFPFERILCQCHKKSIAGRNALLAEYLHWQTSAQRKHIGKWSMGKTFMMFTGVIQIVPAIKRRSDGDINQTHEQLSSKASTMAVDSVSEPFGISSGWSIIKTIAKEYFSCKEFWRRNTRSCKRLSEVATKKREQEWVETLKNKYPVTIKLKKALKDAFKGKRGWRPEILVLLFFCHLGNRMFQELYRTKNFLLLVLTIKRWYWKKSCAHRHYGEPSQVQIQQYIQRWLTEESLYRGQLSIEALIAQMIWIVRWMMSGGNWQLMRS